MAVGNGVGIGIAGIGSIGSIVDKGRYYAVDNTADNTACNGTDNSSDSRRKICANCAPSDGLTPRKFSKRLAHFY